MLRIVNSTGNDDLARVFVAEFDPGGPVEFVESVQPPIPREDKWVLIVSTLFGCPVGCPICDAGLSYQGKLSAAQIMAQIEYLIDSRYPTGIVPTKKLKVQFARMGDPALNDAVLDVLRLLPARLKAPGLMPCISTIAPRGREAFFAELLQLKRALYTAGRFQLQFSLHTTDECSRSQLIPARTWSFREIASYGERFFAPGDRRITLNFAPIQGLPLDPGQLLNTFSPQVFAIKLTPVNPTQAAQAAGLSGLLDPCDPSGCEAIAAGFRRAGFETILSIGEQQENQIGSNCGMLVRQAQAASSE